MKQLTRFAFKEGIVTLFRLSGMLRLLRWLNRNRLIILTYHGVLPAESGVDAHECKNVVDEEVFSWQMRYLAKHYRCLPLAQAVQSLADGRPLPRYAIAVTFDDGLQNNLRYALPVLQRYGIPATIFLTTGYIGHGTKMLWTERVGRLLRSTKLPQTIVLQAAPTPLTVSFRTEREREHVIRVVLTQLKAMPSRQRDQVIEELDNRLHEICPGNSLKAELNPDRYTFLTWAEARQLTQGGVNIGSHTVHHAILSSLSDDQRVDEVVESKREIERNLGLPCTLFSYPNGTAADFDDRDKANLRRAGYLAAVTQVTGLNNKHTDRFALRRLNIGHGHTPQLFIAQVSGLWPWLRSITGQEGVVAPPVALSPWFRGVKRARDFGNWQRRAARMQISVRGMKE